MKKSRDYTLFALAIPFFMAVGCELGIKQSLQLVSGYKYTGYETDDRYVNGQIMQPDSLHSDVRIVVNADSLNYWILNAASDSDLYYGLNHFTK